MVVTLPGTHTRSIQRGRPISVVPFSPHQNRNGEPGVPRGDRPRSRRCPAVVRASRPWSRCAAILAGPGAPPAAGVPRSCYG
jgi:hypothetical protein